MENRRGSIEMSDIEAGPSRKRFSASKSLAPDAANVEKLERFAQMKGLPPSPVTSSKRWSLQRPKSTDGRPLALFDNEPQGGNQSPALGEPSPQPPKKNRLHEYKTIWRSNYTLSLDGGGVRGYSQLIIIKALMDQVARIERGTPDEKGHIVESSFHPLLPSDDKGALQPKSKHRRKKRKATSTESQDNGRSDRNNNNTHVEKWNGKGKEVERQSDSSSSNEQEQGKFYPYHYFDYIAGTSTGGLNAIMLGRLRMSVEECIEGYAEMASKVFGKPRLASYRLSPLFWPCAKYSGDRLREVVKDVVDENLCEDEGYMLASNKEMCRTVVLAIKKNLGGHETVHLFRTYDHHRRRVVLNDNPAEKSILEALEQTGPADSSLIWEVARATSAAPSYFNTIKIGEDEYGDAGFGENNPSKRLFWEVRDMNNKNPSANSLSVSIGTGITRFTRFQTGALSKPVGWLNAAKKIATECESTHREMLLNITDDGAGGKYPYYRFNVPEKATDPDAQEPSKWQHFKNRARKWFGHGGEPLDRGLGKIKLDEWKASGFWRKESTQEEIERVTKEYLKDPEVVAKLNTIAGMMVTHRRNRAKTDRWPAYALGIRYECPLPREVCPDDTWTEGKDLRRHLEEDHEHAGDLDGLLEKGKYYEHHH
ncbi:acyl transferase/acyl hydrolase/lysophospholipase [Halenospora varia]|nr:acyl transferase/acyl hydrolase/lysophospholipase [Halenospora varia]